MYRNKIPYQQKFYHFAKSSMVFPWPVVILQNCVQFHFLLKGNFLYLRRLILDPIDGSLSFSSILPTVPLMHQVNNQA